jgi:hypothetical protein
MREVNDIHVPFKAWLDEGRIPYVYHRPDRPSGIRSGWPDFTICWMRRQIMIECKTPSGKLSTKQVECIDFLRRQGNVVEIARNVSECVTAAYKVLLEGKPAVGAYGACNYPLEGCFKELKRAVAGVPGNGKEDLSGKASESHAMQTHVKRGVSGDDNPPAQNNLNVVPVMAEPTRNSPIGHSEGEARESTNHGPVKQTDDSRGGVQNFYIGDWKGTQYVFAPDQDGNYKMIREASPIDVINLPKLP